MLLNYCNEDESCRTHCTLKLAIYMYHRPRVLSSLCIDRTREVCHPVGFLQIGKYSNTQAHPPVTVSTALSSSACRYFLSFSLSTYLLHHIRIRYLKRTKLTCVWSFNTKAVFITRATVTITL